MSSAFVGFVRDRLPRNFHDYNSKPLNENRNVSAPTRARHTPLSCRRQGSWRLGRATAALACSTHQLERSSYILIAFRIMMQDE